VISNSVALNSEEILASLLNNDIQSVFSGTLLTLDFIAFVFEKFDNLFLKRRVAKDNTGHAI
jgi:hypothetical protein